MMHKNLTLTALIGAIPLLVGCPADDDPEGEIVFYLSEIGGRGKGKRMRGFSSRLALAALLLALTAAPALAGASQGARWLRQHYEAHPPGGGWHVSWVRPTGPAR